MSCVRCGDPKTVAKDRCHCCYEYRRRFGTDRTDRHVVRQTERDIEREQAKRYR